MSGLFLPIVPIDQRNAFLVIVFVMAQAVEYDICKGSSNLLCAIGALGQAKASEAVNHRLRATQMPSLWPRKSVYTFA